MELLLNCTAVRGVTRYLVRRRGHTSADDSWLRLDELAHCAEKVAEYDAAAPRRRAARRSRHAGGGLYGPAQPRVGMTSVKLGGHNALSCQNVPAPSLQTGTEQPRRRRPPLCGSAASRPCWLAPLS